jgi:hypothetical protein
MQILRRIRNYDLHRSQPPAFLIRPDPMCLENALLVREHIRLVPFSVISMLARPMIAERRALPRTVLACFLGQQLVAGPIHPVFDRLDLTRRRVSHLPNRVALAVVFIGSQTIRFAIATNRLFFKAPASRIELVCVTLQIGGLCFSLQRSGVKRVFFADTAL